MHYIAYCLNDMNFNFQRKDIMHEWVEREGRECDLHLHFRIFWILRKLLNTSISLVMLQFAHFLHFIHKERRSNANACLLRLNSIKKMENTRSSTVMILALTFWVTKRKRRDKISSRYPCTFSITLLFTYNKRSFLREISLTFLSNEWNLILPSFLPAKNLDLTV